LYRSRAACRRFALVWMLVLPGADSVFCQGVSIPDEYYSRPMPAAKPLTQDHRKSADMPCLQPARLPGILDYQGPLKQTIGIFAGVLDRKTGYQHHYKPSSALCSVKPIDKLLLFAQDSIDPINLLSAGFSAGLDHASNRDPTFGYGAKGYAKRLGADVADMASSKFIKDFAYPAIFSENPRYYRLGRGSTGERLLHAAAHLFVAHHEDGTRMFNYSELLGTASAVALSNVYHPGNPRGVGNTARRIGYSFAFDIGYDVLREFWPELTHKFKLPFPDEL
jgi:hypothetical protein